MMFLIDLVWYERNTFILKCFLQFACTTFDGSQKEGGNFLNLLQKERGTQERKGGGGLWFPQKRGTVPTLVEIYIYIYIYIYMKIYPFVSFYWVNKEKNM